MKDKGELRAMSLQELNSELLTLRKNQFSLRLKRASGNVEKPHVVGLLRKSIALVKTIMTEKKGVSHD